LKKSLGPTTVDDFRVADDIQSSSGISGSNTNVALMVDKHPRSDGISSSAGLKGQLASTVRLCCSSDASGNPLRIVLDRAVFDDGLRFRIYRRVDPQGKTAQDLVDWHNAVAF
jgi:hypothetical protein